MERLSFKKVLFETGEGWALLTFFSLAFVVVGLFFYYLRIDPIFARTLSLALVANATGGRAAGVVICLKTMGVTGTILYNTLMEILNVCLMYALFVLSLKRYLNFNWFKRMSVNLEIAAHKYEKKISVYGWVGLFFFVMIPLPITGPVVGSIIGYFLHMKPWKNFSAVISGSVVSIILWAKFFDFISHYLHIMQYLIAAIILIVAISCFKLIKSFYREFICKENKAVPDIENKNAADRI